MGQATTASQWKGRKGIELPLPSGNVALVRNPGMQHFLRTGVIPDPLTGMIRKMIAGKQDDVDPAELMKDDESLNAALDLFDRILLEVVVQPDVEPAPTRTVLDEESGEEHEQIIPIGSPERDEDTLYVDEVDFNDKTFIFQFAVGGTKDIEEFLQRQKQMLESVSPGSGVDDSSERTP